MGFFINLGSPKTPEGPDCAAFSCPTSLAAASHSKCHLLLKHHLAHAQTAFLHQCTANLVTLWKPPGDVDAIMYRCSK